MCKTIEEEAFNFFRNEGKRDRIIRHVLKAAAPGTVNWSIERDASSRVWRLTARLDVAVTEQWLQMSEWTE